MLSILIVGACATASAAVWSFQAPSNVVAEVSPNLHKYELQRIGIISFLNQSGTPDAGMRVANFFFAELEAQQRYEVAPPLHLDEETELEFTQTAQALPEEERRHPEVGDQADQVGNGRDDHGRGGCRIHSDHLQAKRDQDAAGTGDQQAQQHR